VPAFNALLPKRIYVGLNPKNDSPRHHRPDQENLDYRDLPPMAF